MFAQSARSFIRVASPVAGSPPRRRRAFPSQTPDIRARALAVSQGVFIAVTAILFIAWVIVAR